MNSKNITDVISKLKFIGYLQIGEKINTKRLYVQSCGIITSLSRTFIYQDSRANASLFVQSTIDETFTLLLLLSQDNSECNKEIIKNTITDLLKAKQGLSNLRSTYIDDTKFQCDMQTLIENIDARLKSMTLDKNIIKENET